MEQCSRPTHPLPEDTILRPVDGSDGGSRAVGHALELADRYGAAIDATYVVDPSRYGDAPDVVRAGEPRPLGAHGLPAGERRGDGRPTLVGPGGAGEVSHRTLAAATGRPAV
jgi:nucleotide-binding universal stress UspA family protein